MTEIELVPIIERFFKDGNNEIRICTAKNLHMFLKQVPMEKREHFLEYIIRIQAESRHDWRTRYILSQNIGELCLLFDIELVRQQLLPVFFRFCQDHVTTVRESASQNLSYFLTKFQTDEKELANIIEVVKKNYFAAKVFYKRQNFIHMCEKVMLQKEIFEEHFINEFLSLINDKVAVVRISMAKALAKHFNTDNAPFIFNVTINNAVKLLKKDKSKDVRELVQHI